MFLTKTLTEKLQKAYSQNDLNNQNKPLIAYQSIKKPKNNEGKVLFQSKQREKYLNDINEGLMTKEEIIKDFSSEKMRRSWRQKSQINFTKDHTKFNSCSLPQKTKDAVTYVKNLRDPDLYEYKQPGWDVSSKADEIKRPRLKQKMFEINCGLIPWSDVKFKAKHVEIGTDSRQLPVDKSSQWNVSLQLLHNEKENMMRVSSEKCLNNTQQYWKKYAVNRQSHAELPISDNRKKIESPRYFKSYSNPTQQAINNYELMTKIKKELCFEMEDIRKEVIHENPGCKDIKEKIDALVNKRMYKTFLKKFQLATGKIKEKNLINPNEIYQWKDNELIEKITTVNSWKDLSWYKNAFISPRGKENNSIDCHGGTGMRINLLKTLMPNGQKIMREQLLMKKSHKHKHDNDNDDKIKRCSSTLGNRNNAYNFISKYPIDVEAYKYMSNRSDLNNNDDMLDTDFLNAYKKYALKDVEKENKRRQTAKPITSCSKYDYVHPGIFKKFDHRKDNEDEEQTNEMNPLLNKDEYYFAWSCCLSNNKDSPGCRKKIIRKYQWNYDHNEID